jgi:hypothetical protein
VREPSAFIDTVTRFASLSVFAGDCVNAIFAATKKIAQPAAEGRKRFMPGQFTGKKIGRK